MRSGFPCLGIVLVVLVTAPPARGEDINEAVQRADAAAVKRILEADPTQVSRRDAEGNEPLHNAAHRGNLPIMGLLLDGGAKVNAKGAWQHTPMHYAAHLCDSCRDTKKKAEAMRLLLERGADPLAKGFEPYGAFGSTPLHLAAGYGNTEALAVILAKGVDANLRDDQGRTPLIRACAHGQLETARSLLDRKADLTLKADSGRTALLEAVKSGNIELVALLLQRGADPAATSAQGLTSAYCAALSGKMALVSRFPPPDNAINTPTDDDDGWTLLICAARGGNEEVVKYFLDKGARADLADKAGRTPFYYALRYCPEATIDLLVKRGAKPTFKDESGNTALHLACQRGSLALVNRFLAEQPDTSVRNASGETPLHLAAASGNAEVIELLVAKKSPVNAAQATCATPLHYAAYHGQGGAVRVLLKNGALVNVKDMEGNTPAMAARESGCPDIAGLIEDWGKLHPEARKAALPAGDESAKSRLEAIRSYQGDRFVLILVPFGKVDRALVGEMQAKVHHVLGISVLLEDSGVDLPSPEGATRRLEGVGRQWDTAQLLEALRKYAGFHGRPNIGVLAVTGEDMYSEHMNFLFGSADKGVAVMSYCRFNSPRRELVLKRALNQALSSTGLLFGIPRCTSKTCPRAYPRNLQEHDAKSEALCPQCVDEFVRKFGTAGRPLRDPPARQGERIEVF